MCGCGTALLLSARHATLKVWVRIQTSLSAVPWRSPAQVLPRAYADARTYNMVVTVCVRAADLPQVHSF